MLRKMRAKHLSASERDKSGGKRDYVSVSEDRPTLLRAKHSASPSPLLALKASINQSGQDPPYRSTGQGRLLEGGKSSLAGALPTPLDVQCYDPESIS